MKVVLSICLCFVVLIASMSETMIYTAFKINQSEIVQNFCINKNAPEKNCEGKCYLKDRLSDSDSENNAPSPRSIFEDTAEINFFPNIISNLKNTDTSSPATHNFREEFLMSQSYFSSLLRPPQLV